MNETSSFIFLADPGRAPRSHRIIAALCALVIVMLAAYALWILGLKKVVSKPDPLFASSRLDGQLKAATDHLGNQPVERLDITGNLISIEAVAADGDVHMYWVQDGKVEDVNSMPASGGQTFHMSDVSADRIRAVVVSTRGLHKLGELQQVSYWFDKRQKPLSVSTWIRHDPLSSVLNFDPQKGNRPLWVDHIETDENTGSFGGCWC